MHLWLKILIIILILIVVAFIALMIIGSRLQKKQGQQQILMEQMAQTVSILVIDKKKMKLKEVNLPKGAIEQTPRYARNMKTPVVKAKVGNRVMTLLADPTAFEVLPVKQEAKVVVSGIYITEVKSVRGSAIIAPAKKKGIRAKISGWARKKQGEMK